MKLTRLCRAAAALLASLLTSTAVAACMESDQKRMWNYGGTMGAGNQIRMTLIFTGDNVGGDYFYISQRKNIALRGLVAGDSLVLEELAPGGAVAARLTGKLDKDCHLINGSWQKTGSRRKVAVSLAIESGSPGTLDHRYAVAGAEDDALLHRNAQQLWQAVKNKDRKALAALVAYPLRAQVAGQTIAIENEEQLLAHYKAIFTPQYRSAILNSVPHNMTASWEGIMLGNKGVVWFNKDGKAFVFNN